MAQPLKPCFGVGSCEPPTDSLAQKPKGPARFAQLGKRGRICWKQTWNTKMGNQVHAGGCQCGAVRITATDEPKWVATCHCTDCRKATGAAMATYAGFSSEAADISGGAYKEFESSPGTFRGFCETCGAWLTYRSTRWADEVHFHVGAFEDPDAFAPQVNVYTVEKLSWVQLEPNLPELRKTSAEED